MIILAEIDWNEAIEQVICAVIVITFFVTYACKG